MVRMLKMSKIQCIQCNALNGTHVKDIEDIKIHVFLAELFRGMLFKWKGENKKSHQKWDLIVNLRPWLAK